ncbi:MAG TPA: cyclodeaminase/cyclohydrolase family protein [Candidatus Limnocylindrales bacterium]|nr:cyclodeaminase/cyclohydrolase family protein [Candidatus Limnocylindrales bacterium]
MHPSGNEVRFRDLTIDAFSSRLASSEPVPGGGSASAVAAALGANLVTMVASLTTGRPKYVDHEPMLAWAMDTGRRLSDRFLAIADEDAEAYAGFSAALKMPRETEDEIAARTDAMQRAARGASEVPLRCLEACLDLVGAAEALAGRSNPNAASDVDVAALLGEAAARGAAANVLINLPSTGDPQFEGETTARVTGLLSAIEDLASSAHQAVASGERRDPIEPAVRA